MMRLNKAFNIIKMDSQDTCMIRIISGASKELKIEIKTGNCTGHYECRIAFNKLKRKTTIISAKSLQINAISW